MQGEDFSNNPPSVFNRQDLISLLLSASCILQTTAHTDRTNARSLGEAVLGEQGKEFVTGRTQ